MYTSPTVESQRSAVIKINLLSAHLICVVKIACNTLPCGKFLSISQIERQAHFSKKNKQQNKTRKAGKEGNTNFIVSSEERTAEPRVVIHAPVAQITVETTDKSIHKQQTSIGFLSDLVPKRNP